MTTAVLTRTLRHARDSWRGQICVLLAGGIVLGLVEALTGVGSASVVAFLFASAILLGGAVMAADLELDEFGPESMLVHAYALAQLTPRLIVQFVAATAPAWLAGWLILTIAGAMPAVGLLLVLALFPLALASSVVSMLAIAAVVGGDRQWLPIVAWCMFIAKPVRLVGTLIVGVVCLGMASVPIALFGFVLVSLTGPLGVLVSGIASSALVPLTGCFVLALWEHADPPKLETITADPEPAGTLAAFETPWVDGPTWTVTLEPGTVWGSWVRLEAAAQVAIRVTWSGGLAPQVAVGREDGTWIDPGQPAQSGQLLPVSLPAGNSYLQVGSREAMPQVVTMTMLVRAAAAAA